MTFESPWLKIHNISRLSCSCSTLSIGAVSLLLTLSALPRAEAQSATDRDVLEHFRDSLSSTADSVGLLSLEKRLIAAAKADRSNGVAHLKLGFLSLRLGDL